MQILLSLSLLIAMCESAPYKISNEYTAKSYNFRQRFLVLHYTVSDLKQSLDILTKGSVSSHYLVPQGPVNGERNIYGLVSEANRAWTQGVSYWRGRENLNDQGVSLEIVNSGYVENGDGSRKWFPFQPYQIDSVIALSKDIIKRYDIEPTNVFGHGDCAPGRKVDPGPLFPWKQLYDNGIGAWPNKVDVDYFIQNVKSCKVGEVQEGLSKYGYLINRDGLNTEQTKNAVIAFQMHFRPNRYDGVIDIETVSILKALLRKYR